MEIMTKIGPELTTEPWRVVMDSIEKVAREAAEAAREDRRPNRKGLHSHGSLPLNNKKIYVITFYSKKKELLLAQK